MKLNIGQVKEKMSSGGGKAKNINPGIVKAKINSIQLEQPEFLKKKNGYFLVLNIETEKLGDDFEGFLIDPNDESKGRYEGQVGKIKMSSFAFQDTKLKSGVEIIRDNEIIKQLIRLTEETNTYEWLASKDEKLESIEQLIEEFNKENPLKDIFLYFVIGGRGYHNKQGYVAYDLHLPKFTNEGKLFSMNEDELVTFTKETMVEEPEKKEMESFDDGDIEGLSESDSSSDDEGAFDIDGDDDAFDLDDEF